MRAAGVRFAIRLSLFMSLSLLCLQSQQGQDQGHRQQDHSDSWPGQAAAPPSAAVSSGHATAAVGASAHRPAPDPRVPLLSQCLSMCFSISSARPLPPMFCIKKDQPGPGQSFSPSILRALTAGSQHKMSELRLKRAWQPHQCCSAAKSQLILNCNYRVVGLFSFFPPSFLTWLGMELQTMQRGLSTTNAAIHRTGSESNKSKQKY